MISGAVRRLTALAVLVSLLAGTSACRAGCSSPRERAKARKAEEAERPRRERGRAAKAERGSPTVLLIVMDTVRSANMSLCGYDRPTTPFLETIAGRSGQVAWTCDAYAPGTWTIPSHTSMFTGLAPPEHHNDSMSLPFDAEVPTLAEAMKAKGYQTLLVSANPTLSEKSGLHRGFDVAHIAPTLVSWRGGRLARELRDRLAELPTEQPLFVVVNLIDAHDPYPEIPASIGWLPAQRQIPYRVHDDEQDSIYHRWLRDELEPDVRAAFLQAVVDGYDYGILEVDRNVDRVMSTLRSTGWLESGFRVVVTSDHGEFLGEHGLLRHGCYTWEPVTRVPFLYYDPTLREPLELPTPLSATQAFHLLKDGELGDDVPVASFSKRRQQDVRGCADMVATHPAPADKLVWREGEVMRFDLAADPGEEAPKPLPAEHPGGDELARWAKAHTDHLAIQRGKTPDAERLKELEALGYVE